jgi:HK97 family phage portal protein
MDEAAFTQRAITSRDIAGRFYAEIVRGQNGLPVRLYPLNPAKVFVIPRDDKINDYEFRNGDKRVIIKGEDMIDWSMESPLNEYDALSPLAVCLGSVDADRAQTDFIRAFFNNSGVPSGILTVKNRTLNQAQADEIRGKWRLMFGRQFGSQHDVAVLDENAEYQKIGQGVGELQGDSLREFVETRVFMVFGTPPLITYAYAGLLRSTYSNLGEANEQFWDLTLTPWFKEWRTFLTWRLLTEFVSEDLLFGERVRLNWDMSQVAALQEDVDAIYARALEAFKAGGLMLNEYREKIGEKPDPAGDYYLRPFNVLAVPVGSVPTEEPAAPAQQQQPPATQRASALTPGVKKAIAKAQAAGRRTIERRIERDVKKMLSAHYEAAAAAVERAA